MPTQTIELIEEKEAEGITAQYFQPDFNIAFEAYFLDSLQDGLEPQLRYKGRGNLELVVLDEKASEFIKNIPIDVFQNEEGTHIENKDFSVFAFGERSEAAIADLLKHSLQHGEGQRTCQMTS